MIDIQIPVLKDYNTDNAAKLATDLKNLRSFDEIAEWDRRSASEIDGLQGALRLNESNQQKIALSLEEEKGNHEAKAFLSRLFSGRPERKRLLTEKSRLEKENGRIKELIDQFESAIEFTPDSTNDLKELLKECKQRKKELLTEKKAIGAQMTAIRVEARQKTADSFPGKYGKWDRRKIRLDKEASLQPHENERSAIERQVIRLERVIVWLERFK